MKPIYKILSALAVFGAVFGGRKLMATSNTAKKISVTLGKVAKPKIKGGALVLSVDVVIDNPTTGSLNLKKPYLTVSFGGKEIANSIASNEYKVIKPNDRTTITGINIQIPFLKLGGLAFSLITGNVPKLEIDVTLSTVANSIPYTDTKHFEL